MKQEIIHYKPGIYRFEWPYLGGSLVPNDKGEVTVYKCDVELRVGQDEDIRERRLITVVVTSMLPQVLKIILNTLQLKFKIAFFDQIFIEKRWEKPVVPEDGIRWIEQHLYSKQNGGDASHDLLSEVTMEWDSKRFAILIHLGSQFQSNRASYI
ncbi:MULTISPECIES: hypothetical protein [Paenibacillus]|uniref:hypothetical protein n=1 Tax=Paenibacillus TaxID=44249 RepID=UPI000AE4FF02|nr:MULTISPECIES: hypothetical protein [Paenibacillus]QYK63264.1 hypothetical protein KAI37_03597 [Paenibacillus sp. S25]